MFKIKSAKKNKIIIKNLETKELITLLSSQEILSFVSENKDSIDQKFALTI